MKNLLNKLSQKFHESEKTTYSLFYLLIAYHLIIFAIFVPLLKKKFKVKNIIIGHYHKEFNLGSLKILEAYYLNKKIYKVKNYYIITDVHLGLVNYSKEELKELKEKIEEIIKNNKLIITGDLIEKKPLIKNKEIKEIINKILNNKNIIYIKGNHDPKIKKQLDFFVSNNILFIHGHQLMIPFHLRELFKLFKSNK
ncbi:MAG: metallophosphoesterase [Nanoarchaeota archaeon]